MSSRLRSILRTHWAFILIVVLFLCLRLYHLSILTTFGGDQGQDFLVVRDMIVLHKFTLIGIKTSIADFFQGPLYLYLLFPLFSLMHLNPLAGALTAVVLAMVSLFALYITLITFFNKNTALGSCLLLTVSPEFVRYGNTPLYQNFLPLFLVLSFYMYLKVNEKRTFGLALLLGMFAGICMELHFLAVTLTLAFLILLLVKRFPKRVLILYCLGVIVGLSPTIFFELRHNFLNTHLLINYLTSYKTSSFSLQTSLNAWFEGAGKFLGGNNTSIGILLLIFSGYSLVKTWKNKVYSPLIQLFVCLIVILVVFTFVFSNLLPHYLLPLWIMLVILIPLFIEKVSMKLTVRLGFLLILVVVNLSTTLTQLGSTHGYDMPDGWTLQKAVRVGDMIAKDSKTHPNFNVAFLLDGNTRSYPLRYVLATQNAVPGSVTDYPSTTYLYVVSRPKDNLFKTMVWEVASV
ncbi:MAG TPA: glycosyltransferase family 39 protein, partial [Patescibacteria group bacterium]|nr:glycosyltransferase family 39 protein [Patescibacteria group bacterium]